MPRYTNILYINNLKCNFNNGEEIGYFTLKPHNIGFSLHIEADKLTPVTNEVQNKEELNDFIQDIRNTFDNTVLIPEEDEELGERLKALMDVFNVRTLPSVTLVGFAEHVYNEFDTFLGDLPSNSYENVNGDSVVRLRLQKVTVHDLDNDVDVIYEGGF